MLCHDLVPFLFLDGHAWTERPSMRMALAGIICDGAAKGGRPSRRRDERPMRGPHGGAYRSVSRIPSGESARCAEEALLRRAGREATAKPPARARARSRRVRRGGPPARRRFDKVNASPSPRRGGDTRNCSLNQSAIQHLPLTT